MKKEQDQPVIDREQETFLVSGDGQYAGELMRDLGFSPNHSLTRLGIDAHAGFGERARETLDKLVNKIHDAGLALTHDITNVGELAPAPAYTRPLEPQNRPSTKFTPGGGFGG